MKLCDWHIQRMQTFWTESWIGRFNPIYAGGWGGGWCVQIVIKCGVDCSKIIVWLWNFLTFFSFSIRNMFPVSFFFLLCVLVPNHALFWVILTKINLKKLFYFIYFFTAIWSIYGSTLFLKKFLIFRPRLPKLWRHQKSADCQQIYFYTKMFIAWWTSTVVSFITLAFVNLDISQVGGISAPPPPPGSINPQKARHK